MGLFDMANRWGGNPAQTAAQPMPSMAQPGRGRLPWGSGFEGMNVMSDEERKKALLMQMIQQMQMGQQGAQMPLAGGGRR